MRARLQLPSSRLPTLAHSPNMLHKCVGGASPLLLQNLVHRVRRMHDSSGIRVVLWPECAASKISQLLMPRLGVQVASTVPCAVRAACSLAQHSRCKLQLQQLRFLELALPIFMSQALPTQPALSVWVNSSTSIQLLDLQGLLRAACGCSAVFHWTCNKPTVA